MPEKIAILIDTNSGVKQEDIDKYGFFVVPMPFIIDGEEYYEGKNLDNDTFYNKLVNDADIHTSQPSLGATTNIYDEILKEYDYIVHIPMSSALSKTYETATMLSHEEEYEGKIFVVDNHRISYSILYSAIEAYELVKLGKSAKEIKEFLEETANDSSIYLMVDTLKYLKKGGRVTPAAALLGSLLGIRPILQIQGGKLDAFDKCRTVKASKKSMIDQMKKDIHERFNDDVVLAVVHSYNDTEVPAFYEECKNNLLGVTDNIEKLSFSITCHTGPGVLAIACCKKHHFE